MTPNTPQRSHLLGALRADLIGPYDPESGAEVLVKPPMRWYLTGFLVPEGELDHDTAAPGDEDESIEAGDEPQGEDNPEPAAKQRPILPSAIGLSVLLPDTPASGTDTVTLELSWGQYVLHNKKEDVEKLCAAKGISEKKAFTKKGVARDLWERVPIKPPTVTLDLSKAKDGELERVPVPNSAGVHIEYRLERLEPAIADKLRIGKPGEAARALAVFVVNSRNIMADREKDGRGYSRELNAQTLFQLELSLHAPQGLLPRPDAHFSKSLDFDDRMVDLQFRDEVEWVVGHGIAAEPLCADAEHRAHPKTNPAIGARIRWLPRTRVARVKPIDTKNLGVVVDMFELAEIESPDDVTKALGALAPAYAKWIREQAAIPLDEPGYQETQKELVSRANDALERIEAGIQLLRDDPGLRQAFAWTNKAMAEVAKRRIKVERPAWRLFQLAFLLLNIRGVADPCHDDRRDVELLFFPTGGGKTEAYLGVIAMTLLLRRMRGQAREDRGLGVTVLLRYTLRLLTLDQLERASALICSLELLRREHPDQLGEHRYSIGLWVGRSGSPNYLKEAKKAIEAYKGNTAESRGSPFPLVKCPWCDTELKGRLMYTLPHGKAAPTRTVVVCSNKECEFSGLGRGDGGKKVGELPVLFVDEHIYNELPSFVVATVDKFAMLTHRGQAGKLFGRVHSYTDQLNEPRRFWGGGDGDDHIKPGKGAEHLPDGLRPPELIVQDELHLISGPLGTMVGLFETLVESLCEVEADDHHRAGPKIIAATATVRRATEQVRALYGRAKPEQTKLFPPQGVDAWQTFFAERDTGANERMYVGVAAAGRSMKRNLLTSYLALLGAGESLFQADPTSADPYKTVVGYFNSLRELGGMRRLVDDEVHSRAGKLDERVPLDHRAPHRWFRSREIGDPVELTSRERTSNISRNKARLETKFLTDDNAKKDKDALKPVDVALASNMIAVGVDIDRLGLMVMAGQPKTTSEYIQASSRVGRDDKRPGLVVTVYNLHKPRDRSHYEHFVAYHESFYRYVEAQSVTPFSLPALDRGLASVVVGMVRHTAEPKLAAPRGAEQTEAIGRALPHVADILAARAEAQTQDPTMSMAYAVKSRTGNIGDRWRNIINPTVDSEGSKGRHCYSPYERKIASAVPLMRTPEDDASLADDEKIPYTDNRYPFVAPTSMRDVEPSIALWVRRRPKQEED